MRHETVGGCSSSSVQGFQRYDLRRVVEARAIEIAFYTPHPASHLIVVTKLDAREGPTQLLANTEGRYDGRCGSKILEGICSRR